MKIKKTYLILLISLIISIICIIFLINNKRTEPVVYNFSINNDELRLKNFTIVSCNNCWYVPDNYYIEKVHKNKDIRDVFIEISYKNNLLVDFAFQFDHLTTVTAPIDIFINDLKLNKDPTIIVKFKYTIAGTDKEFYEVINLNKHIKHK